MAINQVVLGVPGDGVVLDWQGRNKGRIFLSNSLDNDSLGIDTMDLEHDLSATYGPVIVPKTASALMAADGRLLAGQPVKRYMLADPAAYAEGHPITFCRNGKLFIKGYLRKKMTPTVGTTYSIQCHSGVGILSEAFKHYGGIYEGVEAGVLIDEIIGGLIPYTLDPAFKHELLFGYLPIADRRRNLHQVLFALGASVFKNNNGDVYIGALNPNAEYQIIPPGRVYSAGGSVAPIASVSHVTVVEHKYFVGSDVAQVVLHDGEVESDQVVSPMREVVNGEYKYVTYVGQIVTFDQPIQPLSLYAEDTSGTEVDILVRDANYCILPPSGSLRLVGTPYTHTTRQITRPTATGRSASSLAAINGKAVTVSEATLVSMVNSENVADRVYSYYKNAEIVKCSIVVENERPGDKVQFTDPKGRQVQGIIASMDINVSNTLKAAVEVVTGYTPTGVGNYYKNSEIITQDGTFTVPLNIKTGSNGKAKVRLVLIGGGSGGWSGAPGEDGEKSGGMGTNTDTPGQSGRGGAVGIGGAGGRVYVVTLEVTPGQTLTFTIGKGGKGGVCDGTASVKGSDGTATVCGEYSSAQGAVSQTGYVDILNGGTYGYQGPVGWKRGGDGNNENGTVAGVTAYDEQGNPVTRKPGANGTEKSTSKSSWTANAGGGLGGGAGSKSDGVDGKNGTVAISSDGRGTARGGVGGDGGDGADGKKGAVPGDGGQGGDGGGGGGGGGYANNTDSNRSVCGGGGKGGLGGNGGDGADGAAIVYF